MSDRDDYEMFLFLSGGGGCSLDSSPKSNWVQKAGGLPTYICRVARAVLRSGHGKSQAIAIAVGRVKAWAAGADGVTGPTKAKAAAAVAQWEALKAKSKAGKVVKATHPLEGTEYLMFANTNSFNTEIVRMAWENEVRQAAAVARADRESRSKYDDGYGDDDDDGPTAAPWIRELWTDFIIVEIGGEYEKIPYTVDGMEVEFGTPVDVTQSWTEVPEDDDDDDELSPEEMALLGRLAEPESDE